MRFIAGSPPGLARRQPTERDARISNHPDAHSKKICRKANQLLSGQLRMTQGTQRGFITALPAKVFHFLLTHNHQTNAVCANMKKSARQRCWRAQGPGERGDVCPDAWPRGASAGRLMLLA
jgi:hypothetical protein